MITNSTGTTCFDADYYPYGGEMDHTNTCPQNYKFTGYERDAETGLDYAFFRYYNSRLGRFMSADPFGGLLPDPQTLNRYAYVRNSPTKLIDPTGQVIIYRTGEVVVLQSWNWDEFSLLLFVKCKDEAGEGGCFIDNAAFTYFVYVLNSLFPDLGSGIGRLPLTPRPHEPLVVQPPCSTLQAQNPAEYSFVAANYQSAQTLAALGGTTAANILGLSLLESTAGTSPIALNYGNYFGLTYPFPGSGPPYNSPNGFSYSTYPTGQGIFPSGISLLSSPRFGPRIAGAIAPQAFESRIEAPPSFNGLASYPGLVNAINSVGLFPGCFP